MRYTDADRDAEFATKAIDDSVELLFIDASDDGLPRFLIAPDVEAFAVFSSESIERDFESHEVVTRLRLDRMFDEKLRHEGRYRRGEKRARSTCRGAPSRISSAIASPVAGALSMPQTL